MKGPKRQGPQLSNFEGTKGPTDLTIAHWPIDPRFVDLGRVYLRADDAAANSNVIDLSAAAFQGAPTVTENIDLWFEDVGRGPAS